MAVRIGIEGASARESWQEFASLRGLRTTLESTSNRPDAQSPERGMEMVEAIGHIVGLTADALAVGVFVWEWYKRRKKEDSTLSVVIELPDGTRFSLDNATEDDVRWAVRAVSEKTP